MGQLKIIPDGVQLTGQTLIMDLLRASSIRSKHGQPITIGKSSHEFVICPFSENVWYVWHHMKHHILYDWER